MHLSKISLALRQWGAVEWSPSSLFASGEQGAWYDPSDLTTMFQDRTGTTPVTADGEPVGLILDKSKGLVLGAELVTNTGPFTNTTGWTTNQATLSVADGTMKVTATATGFAAAVQTLSVTPNTWHKINTVTNYVDGPVARFCALYDTPPSSDTLGNFQTNLYTVGYIKSGADGTVAVNLYFAPTVIGQSFEISSISIKEIAGNHAVAPNDAARPLYKTSGGLHWLQFDGVDDGLVVGTPGVQILGDLSIFYGVVRASNSAGRIFTQSEQPWSFTSYEYGWNAHGSPAIAQAWNQGQSFTGPLVHSWGFTQNLVLSALRNSNAIQLRVNGTNDGSPSGTLTAPVSGGTQTLQIGIRKDGYGAINGRVYSAILLGRLATTQEITDTETWVNGKTGAY